MTIWRTSVLFCIFSLLGNALPASEDVEDWKPILDLPSEDHPFGEEYNLNLSDEYQFPTNDQAEPSLFNLDTPIPAATQPSYEIKLPKAAQNEDKLPPLPVFLPHSEEKEEIAQAATPPTASEAKVENQPILINFNNVNIQEFIRFISRVSNKNFIFDDADLQFNVTIVSEEPTTLENIMTGLMQVLRVHNLILIEQGNNILIHKNKAVNQISTVVAEGMPAPAVPNAAELITRVFRLNTLDAEKAAVIIQPLVSDTALVEVLPQTGHIIVTDLTTNVDKIGQLLKSLDAPNSGLTLGQYVVVNALLDSLIGLAEKVMEPIAEGRPLVFVAHIPSNSVFVVSTPFLVDRALAVLRTLDINKGTTQVFSADALRFTGTSQIKQESIRRTGATGLPLSEQEIQAEQARQAAAAAAAGTTGVSGVVENVSPWTVELPAGHIERTKFYIHKLRYRQGDQIVDALGKVAASLQDTGTGNLDLIASIESIQWLEASNSLVFTGTTLSITKVKELIEEIDTPLRQVFIEMLILETDLTDSLEYGVNFASRFGGINSAGSQAFLNAPNALNSTLDTSQLSGGTINPGSLTRDLGYHLGVIGRNITKCGVEFSTIAALVTAIHDKTKNDIIMNPKVLVEDNTTAEIFVGLNTPFKTQSIANDQGTIITNNFEFRDVGTTLQVTPIISSDDMITLEIHEEVSSIANLNTVAGTLDPTQPGPTTRLSRTTTKFHVPNKFFLVMSGMIQDEYDRERNQVPCLGGVPVIGALFSDKKMADTKRNLMIFIRPQIIDTEAEMDAITRHQQDVYRLKNRTKKMWKYEVEEALDLLNLKEPDVSLHDTEVYNP